jgi:hypothetical protein
MLERPGVLALVFLAACGGPASEAPSGGSAGYAGAGQATPGGGAAGDGAAGKAGAARAGGQAGAGGGGAGAEGSGELPGCEPEAGGVCVDEVRGRVVDTSQKALPTMNVTVCGTSCFLGQTDAQGQFAVKVGASLQPGSSALLVHGRPTHGSTYLRLPGLASVISFEAAAVVPELPPSGPILPADGGPASEVVSGPLTLSLADATAFELDVDDLDDGDAGRMLRVASVDPALVPFATGALVALALAPFGARLSAPAGVSIAGVSGLAEGQRVEFFILDDELLADDGNRAGLPRVVATGEVKGGVLKSDPGQGLDRLTWIAVRKQ